jgi:curved DNA-binding protein CbpA
VNNDDLYGILGAARTASAAEIKEHFRFLSHAYHPDKFATESQRKIAEEKFKKINEAYQILSDPASRARYDASRAGSSEPPPPPPADSYEQRPSPTPALKQSHIKWRIVVRALAYLFVILPMFGALAYLFFLPNQDFRHREKRIDASPIELVNLTLQPSQFVWGKYLLLGQVRNRSSHKSLKRVGLKITMTDKLPSGESKVIGERYADISVTAPPEETREFSAMLSFDDMSRPRGDLIWICVIQDFEVW